MFQFPAFPSYPYVFRIRYLSRYLETKQALGLEWSSLAACLNFQVSKVGFPIRISMDQSVFAAPHGFSQRITSFIGCACQGIHQMPLRHLIVLIASAHAIARAWQKRPASRDLSDGAVRQPILMTAIGARPPTLHGVEPGQIFSSRCMQNRRHHACDAANFFLCR